MLQPAKVLADQRDDPKGLPVFRASRPLLEESGEPATRANLLELSFRLSHLLPSPGHFTLESSLPGLLRRNLAEDLGFLRLIPLLFFVEDLAGLLDHTLSDGQPSINPTQPSGGDWDERQEEARGGCYRSEPWRLPGE